MKTRNILLSALLMIGLIMFSSPLAIAQSGDGQGNHFADLNGDGFNDSAPDHDGDGIPNGLDPDFVKQAKDGEGYKHMYQYKGTLSENSKTMNKTMYQKYNQYKISNSYQFQKKLLEGTAWQGMGEGIYNGTGPQDGTAAGGETGQKGDKGQGQ